MEKGHVLVGPSGRVFNALLKSAGVAREECWVGNVFGTQLPDNEVAEWCWPTGEAVAWGREHPGIKGPPPLRCGWLRPEHWDHLEACAASLAAAAPSLVVPMGATALWALTGNDELKLARGAVGTATRLVPGVKILPTYHPAFVLRQWKFFPVVVGDFLKALRECEFPEVRPPRRRILVEPTLAEIRAYWEETLSKAALISVDIETGWGQITCIGFAASSEEALVVPFWDFSKPSRSYWATAEEEAQAWLLVREIMESGVPKLGQNFTYDTFWLLERMGIKPMEYREETRLLHHALYPELPKSLAFMGASYTQQGAWKMMKDWTGKGKDED